MSLCNQQDFNQLRFSTHRQLGGDQDGSAQHALQLFITICYIASCLLTVVYVEKQL